MTAGKILGITMSHIITEFLDIDKHKCTACGDCVEACPEGAIAGMV
jgi:ferredoxin